MTTKEKLDDNPRSLDGHKILVWTFFILGMIGGAPHLALAMILPLLIARDISIFRE